MSNPKSREEQNRDILKTGDRPAETADRRHVSAPENHDPLPKHPDARQSERVVSRQGMHQESRHNKPGD